ncbi:MAG: hypothetical protein A2014_04780 [Spirochaetes bacterium GWF1_49_6]|nr:MAG: hypothetical protein A2014_04780 [Spirochaetes bacterium GWF1_49_6]
MPDKKVQPRTEFMSPEDIEMVKKAMKHAGSPFSFIIFLSVAFGGLIFLVIGVAVYNTLVSIIGGIWLVVFGFLSVTVKWVGGDYKKDITEQRKIVEHGEILGKRVDKEKVGNKVVIRHLLIVNGMEFEVSEGLYTRFDVGDIVEIRYSKHARVLLAIHEL